MSWAAVRRLSKSMSNVSDSRSNQWFNHSVPPNTDPAQIQKITELVMVDEWADAYLECYVNANPSPETTIKWRRRYRNETDTGLNSQAIDSARMTTLVESVDQTSSQANSQITLKGTLVIYNASLEDSGQAFECVANNGVGDTDTALITLLVLRE